MSRLRVEARGGALDRPVGNARQRWGARQSWLLTLEEDGIWGQGECSPLPGFSLEKLEEVEAALALLPVSAETLPTPTELNRHGAKDARRTHPWRPWRLGGSSLACALTMARLDLEGRRCGVPVAELLSPSPRESVPISALLVEEPGEGLLAEAAARAAEGYRTLKWKVGRAGRWAEELRWIRALREGCPAIDLRLDINQGWSFDEARERLGELAALGVSLVEEPCSPPFPPSPVPLAADESLLKGELSDLGAVSALVLKPMALGPERCLTLAREAEARGLGVLVTHLFDGPLALAFAVELARALPGELLACGLAPHPGLGAWGVEGIPGVEGGFGRGFGPGLGLERL